MKGYLAGEKIMDPRNPNFCRAVAFILPVLIFAFGYLYGMLPFEPFQISPKYVHFNGFVDGTLNVLTYFYIPLFTPSYLVLLWMNPQERVKSLKVFAGLSVLPVPLLLLLPCDWATMECI